MLHSFTNIHTLLKCERVTYDNLSKVSLWVGLHFLYHTQVLADLNMNGENWLGPCNFCANVQIIQPILMCIPIFFICNLILPVFFGHLSVTDIFFKLPKKLNQFSHNVLFQS